MSASWQPAEKALPDRRAVEEEELPWPWRARVREAYVELRALAAEASDPVLQRRAIAAAERLAGPYVTRQPPVELTSRELDVLALVGDGCSNRAIATTLGITVHTVKSHLKNLMPKLAASTRLEAVVHARSDGLIP